MSVPVEESPRAERQRQLLEQMRPLLDELPIHALVEYLALRTGHTRGERELRFRVKHGRFQAARVIVPLDDR